VIYYRLEWDQGALNVWQELNSYSLGMAIETSYTHTSATIFPSGGTLNYRLTPKNGVGYGNPSTATSVLCD